VLDLPLKPIEASTFASGGSALVETKSFNWVSLFLLKFIFQYDEEPKFKSNVRVKVI
jgi:hypothetical protein